ncbi:hypothetical protein Btru_053522 [Bulinus truncatus]|nr:hypothetical protein Btru_053522 [Bulinus truncatus]
MSQDLCRCGNSNLAVFLLVILFGISSWVDINGLWVELPILVQHLPEGWDLPSYMAIIIQVANIAPLTYTVASVLFPHRVLEVPVIYVIISLGILSCLLLAFLWNVTSTVAGQLHSTALFVLQFCLALVDCTSSVAFLPFMSRLKPQYMPAYFIGEGFSGLIPSLVALAQGAGSMRCITSPIYHNKTEQIPLKYDISKTTRMDSEFHFNFTEPNTSMPQNNLTAVTNVSVYPVYEDPRFSVGTFFLFLMSMLIISFVSFVLLNYWSYSKREYASCKSQSGQDEDGYSALTAVQKDDFEESQTKSGWDLQKNGEVTQFVACDDLKSSRKTVHPTITRSKFAIFILLTGGLNAMSNGVLPSIQTYACLPYGIQAYHLSVNMASIANPLACVALIFLKMTSLTGTLLTSSAGAILSTYVIYTASTSPSPPFVGHFFGSALCIVSWALAVFLLTYSKVAIATALRSKGKRSLLWVGAASQAGSLAGAFVTFLLVNVYKLFQPANPCV